MSLLFKSLVIFLLPLISFSLQQPSVNVSMGLFIRLSTWNSKTNDRVRKGIPWEVTATTALLAVKHFNQRIGTVVPDFGTKLNDCNVQLIPHVFDTQSHPKPAVQSFLRSRYNSDWLKYKPEVIVGTARSATTTPLAVLAGIEGVPHISYLATSTELDKSNDYPTFLRTIPSDSLTATTIVKLLAGPPYNIKRLSAIYVSDPYGQSYMEALQDACISRGILFDSFSFTFHNVATIESAAKKMNIADVRYVVAIAFDDDLESLMKIASKYKIAGDGKTTESKHQWIFTDSIQSVQHVKDESAKLALQGSIRIYANGKGDSVNRWNYFEKLWDNIKASGQSNALISELNEALPPLDVTDPSFSFQLEQNFFDTSLHDRLQKSQVGDGAPWIYDAIASIGLAACLAEEGGDRSGINIHTLAKKNVFEGLTGVVAFNKDGSRSSKTSRIEMYSVTSSMKFDLVGHYYMGNWTLDDKKTIVYNGGGTTPPLFRDEPIVDLHLISETTKILCYFLIGIVVIASIVCTTWTIYNWHEPNVKASQPIFLLLICFGTVLQILTILPLSQDTFENELILGCRSILPLFSFGFCLTMSSLFAKQYRVYIVFRRAARMKKIKNGDATLKLTIGIIVVFLIINAIIIILWDVLSPFQFTIVDLKKDQFNVTISSIGQCQSSSFYTFTIIISIFYILALIVGNSISCLIKNLPNKFHESKWIGYAMISSLQTLAMGLPLMALAGEDSDKMSNSASFATRCLFLFLNSFGVLCFIFGPKILKECKHNDRRNSSESSYRSSSKMTHANSGRSSKGSGSRMTGRSERLKVAKNRSDKKSKKPLQRSKSDGASLGSVSVDSDIRNLSVLKEVEVLKHGNKEKVSELEMTSINVISSNSGNNTDESSHIKMHARKSVRM